MKLTIIALGLIASIFFEACSSKGPAQDDIIGTWQSEEKAELTFNADGTFRGNLIPAEFGFFPPDSFRNVKFNGSGKWEMRRGDTHWQINLSFNKVSVMNKNGCSFPVLIAGTKGILENKPPWYLFVWKEDEGGERYKFLRK